MYKIIQRSDFISFLFYRNSTPSSVELLHQEFSLPRLWSSWDVTTLKVRERFFQASQTREPPEAFVRPVLFLKLTKLSILINYSMFRGLFWKLRLAKAFSIKFLPEFLIDGYFVSDVIDTFVSEIIESNLERKINVSSSFVVNLVAIDAYVFW